MARSETMARKTWRLRLDFRRAVFAATAAYTLGCSSGAAQTSLLPVTIGVEGDPDVPLPGAQVYVGERTLGTTGPDGTVKLTLGGGEGQSFDLSIRCPAGYRSPAAPVSVTLRRLADPAKAPLYKASCKPTMRKVVVAVTADHGPNLPVLYLGREVARTDGAGAAHVLLLIAPGEQFTLTLDTSGKDAEALRPRNPVATFTVVDHDDLFVFDPHFTVEERRRAPAKFHGPTELGH